MNTFGYKLRLTTFGESHGPAIGGVIDGFPSGFAVDFDFIAERLAERRPQGRLETGRREQDEVEWLSGIYRGVTLGTPIAFIVRNRDARPEDYASLEHLYRPSTADLAYAQRYGIRDPRGGGRASGRETVARVVAGALAESWLNRPGVATSVRITTEVTHPEVIPEHDSVAGVVGCRISAKFCRDDYKPARFGNVIGDPVFAKVQARLADAMLSIPGCHSFAYGDPVEGKLGSEYNDGMCVSDGRICYLTNHAGGILGGITTGEDICFRVGFKPTPSIALAQPTVTCSGRNTEFVVPGRHDRCIARRAAAVVRAMAALVLMDLYL